MFLKHASSGDLVEVMKVADLFDPFQTAIQGRFHRGEEMPDAEQFAKSDLVFPSGEALPKCWVDPGYKS